MKKSFLFLFLFINTLWVQAQNTKTPDEFLGYKLGTKFSFHHRIVDYARHVAAQNPTQVKIFDYGTTFEGRPLILVAIATPENLSKLEDIRTSNLKSIGLLEGKPTTKVPAIAWLSYNVHGNEAVSSEAVMQVLYEMLNKSNSVTQNILKNTVVLIDPCINPDGRDRYAQWYNRVTSKVFNATPFAAEHNEPWPGGRFNHYLFDPNRDWAWQTQEISTQRLKIYNQWMPHLHADFHEMGVSSPYYFPPSAKPYHEDLTAWQREFQQTIGEYNKKYFDKNYWLYFSKENYDLLYPSYGDTYPSYNGAIGMTYEQGGGGRAGIAIAKEDGDTLTLSYRIAHHFSASLATLEAISSRSDKTVDEFVKFFERNKNNPVGTYKSFVMKSKGSEAKVKALTGLLDKLNITYGYAGKETSATGVNYQNLKEESFKVEANDLIVSTYQPKGTFVKILFEPKTMLEDSLTYDITAWGMPYAYGLKAFATKEKLSAGNSQPNYSIPELAVGGKPYAYVATYNSFEDVKFLTQILSKGIKVRFNENAFETGGRKFDIGSVIITRTNNLRMGDEFDKAVQSAAKAFGINLLATNSGMVTTGNDFGSGSVNILKNPRVAVISGDGISPTAFGEVWHFFEQQINYPITVIEGSTFSRVPLDQLDVLILADGNYDRIFGNGDALKKWIQGGGKVIALESATSYFADKDGFGLKRKKDGEAKDKPELKTYGTRERESISEQVVGAIYKVDIDKTHPLGYGTDGSYYLLARDPYNFEYLKEGWNVGYLKDNNYITGFVGQKAKDKMKNTLVHGVQELGRGKIVYMADDPIFRGFWYGGKLLFANAVFVVY
ncbi:M14 metallopeptidase family protein [Emticicia sp. 21SJ11W-3]|uniref:M14 metallopeptidase family protein n=1 Tax=Emticicia sp. 21SJ11W-3 TaxID=2916755 RepID=UPI00209C8C8A|nr:M14 metallopeptidase family protein [Emticicia sp. 21SJ11W-3]UTA69684.1 M14 family metallopeptidase [Emticicia sp. 21SJ11W-3]